MIKIIAFVVLIGVAIADPIATSSTSAPEDLDNVKPAVEIEKIPYHVSIRVGGSHRCSGAIISKDWILTAAQCGFRSYRRYSVRAGSPFSDIGGSIHNVSNMIMHDNFTIDTSLLASYDINLIRVTPPLTIDATRRPIELYAKGEETPVGSAAVISGYGHLRYSTQKRDVLLIQNVTLISNDYCKESYTYLAPQDPSQICTVYAADDMDFCQNDAGGPLTVNGRLAGIVSRGTGCPGSGRPLVYTDVGYFRDWIREHSGV